MKVLKIFENVVYLMFSLLAFPILIFAAYAWSQDKDEKFKGTPLNTTIESIEEEWGKPDKEYSDGRIVYFYDDFLGWGQYVFILKKESLPVNNR